MIEHLSDGVIAHISFFGESRVVDEYVQQEMSFCALIIGQKYIKIFKQKSKSQRFISKGTKTKLEVKMVIEKTKKKTRIFKLEYGCESQNVNAKAKMFIEKHKWKEMKMPNPNTPPDLGVDG